MQFPISPFKEENTNQDISKQKPDAGASPIPLFTEDTNAEGNEYYESVGT